MAFFPLLYVKLDPHTKLGILNEGLYVMTYQTNTVTIGVLIGINIGPDRIGHIVKVHECKQPRDQLFAERKILGNIQLSSPHQLIEWASPKYQTVNFRGTPPNSSEELALARRYLFEVAEELRNLK